MCRNTVNNINFHYSTNSVKINDNFFYLKKPCFCPFLGPFSQFLEKNFFSEKSGSVTQNFIWFSSTMPHFRKKLIIQFQENVQIEGQKDGWKDRPYFIRPSFYASTFVYSRFPPKIQFLYCSLSSVPP